MARKKPSAEAFARLFESVHEGVYIGTVDGASSRRSPPTRISS